MFRQKLQFLLYNDKIKTEYKIYSNSYIRCEMTPTSVGGEQQISISGHS